VDDFTGYSTGLIFTSVHTLSDEEVRNSVTLFMAGLAQDCRRSGARVIGHIKAWVVTDGGSTLFASVVGNRPEPNIRQEGDLASKEWRMILNVMIYGLAEERVAELVRKHIALLVNATGSRVTMQQPETYHEDDSGGGHEHHHD
jgi:hypothetical protein